MRSRFRRKIGVEELIVLERAIIGITQPALKVPTLGKVGLDPLQI
jgi:hypothetical protein